MIVRMYSFHANLETLVDGIYFVQLRTANVVSIQKLILTRQTPFIDTKILVSSLNIVAVN